MIGDDKAVEIMDLAEEAGLDEEQHWLLLREAEIILDQRAEG